MTGFGFLVSRLEAGDTLLAAMSKADLPTSTSVPLLSLGGLSAALVAVNLTFGVVSGFTSALTGQNPTAEPPASGPAPMRQLLARGVGPAPVETGLSFALTITNGGRSILAGPWALRIPQVSTPLRLSLEEARLNSGSLEAVARIKNETGAFLGGLRLDFLEIAEGTLDSKHAPSYVSSEAKSRAIALASPLFFGDLQPGADAAASFRLEPVALAPGSPYAVVRGVITGAVAAAGIEVPDSSDPVAIDSDGEGRIYVGDGAGQAIFRIGPDPKSVRRFDAGCPVTGIAVRRKSGELYASCRDVPVLLRLSPGGRMSKTEPIGRALGPIRFGGKGFLYGAPASIVRLDGLSIAEEIASTAQRPFHAAGFDVSTEGAIWAITSEPERRLLRIRSARDIVSLAGPGEGLGAIATARTCRVGPDGNVYVLEGPADARPPRVSVFDQAGGLARVWDLPMGQPADLAFARDGRLEIVWKRENAGSAVTVFRTF